METLTMRSLTLTGAAMLMGMLLTGCGAESGPTAESAPGLTADATSHNTADHFSLNELVADTLVNPCNGETVQLAGTLVGQVNLVDTREHLDAGNALHYEIHAVISETGTGLTTGATYTFHANYHEVFNSPTVAALNFTFSQQDRGHVNSTTPGLSFGGHSFIHVVGLPSGEVKVTREDSGPDECRG
jgi:hypothetical protein